MAGPLGGAVGRSGSSHYQSLRRQWRPPWGLLAAGPATANTGVGDIDGGTQGVLAAGPAATTTEVENVDGGPLGGDGGRSGSGHH
jgi:hypothetical protein